MQYFETVVGQLDLASSLLDADSPVKSRLALILVDNAVEFMLHRYAAEAVARDSLPRSVAERRFPAGLRAQVLSHFFAPKVSFARAQGKLSDDEACFCSHAHPFRNEAYHQGILHDDILYELVGTYHSLACALLPRLGRKSMRGVIGREIPRVLAKHLGVAHPSSLLSRDTLQQVAASVGATCPVTERSLSEALQATMACRVTDISRGLDYILQNSEGESSRDDLIRELQYWHDYYAMAPEGGFAFRDAPLRGVEIDPSQETAWRQARDFMDTEWRPKVTPVSIDRWTRRAEGLGREDAPGRALQKYRKLGEDIEAFETMVYDRCAGIDYAREQALEEARERKRDQAT